MLFRRTEIQETDHVRRRHRAMLGSAGAASLGLIFLSLAFCSLARAETVIARYYVNLGGVRLGEAVIHANATAKDYKVSVTADVGVIFADRKIEGEASGARKGAKLTPEHFQMTVSGGDSNAVDIGFSGATAVSTRMTPPIPEEMQRNRVPLTKDHLHNVLDPLSALLVTSLTSTSASSPCNDVLPVYSGYARFDIRLHPKGESRVEQGRTIVTCVARYVAIAGHPRDDASENVEMTVEFRKLSDPHLWLLERITVPTPMGPVSVERAETKVG